MLTRKQADALAFIRDYIAISGGASPTYAEIAVGIGSQSKSHIGEILDALEGRDLIRRAAGKRRSVQLADHQPLALVSTDALKAELDRRGAT